MDGKAIVLYIFITSDTPDLYINIIGHCIKRYNVTKVVLLGIEEDHGHEESTQIFLEGIKTRVKNQLEFIQKGQYHYKDQDTKIWQEKPLKIESHHASRYVNIAKQHIETYVIIYDKLDTELSNFVNSNNSIFDVSGVSKTYLIDVYTLLQIKDVEDIYVFQLKLPSRTYNEKELIHNLSFKRGYDYINVTTDSPYTRDAIIKAKHKEYLDKKSTISTNLIIEAIAKQFARNVVIVYIVTCIFIFIWTTIFVAQGNWNKLEPWLSLFPFLAYIVTIIASFRSNKELSWMPNFLYKRLRNYREMALKKQFGETLGI